MTEFVIARCLYSKVVEFNAHHYYGFEKHAEYTSFSVYKPLGIAECYATRLLDECGVLVIEGSDGVYAVFEVC